MDRILHLTRPEKVALVAALCITHKNIQPKMNMDITIKMAKETLAYPGILDLLRSTCDNEVLIGLLTLVGSKE